MNSIFPVFDESLTDGPTDQRTNQPTDKASYRDARTHLKRHEKKIWKRFIRNNHIVTQWQILADPLKNVIVRVNCKNVVSSGAAALKPYRLSENFFSDAYPFSHALAIFGHALLSRPET